MSSSKSPLNLFRITGDLTHLLSIIILGLKMKKSRSCSGISLNSQILFAIVYISRYLDLLHFSSFDFFWKIYNFAFKIVFISCQCLVVWFMRKKFSASYDPRLDSFPIRYLLAASAVIALLFSKHAYLSNFIMSIENLFWTFSIVLESVAIFPQLYMLRKTGEAENITTHYLFCLGIYRAMYIVNWVYRYIRFGSTPGYVAFFFGVLQTVLYSDFFYIYYKKVLYGGKFSLLPH